MGRILLFQLLKGTLTLVLFFHHKPIIRPCELVLALTLYSVFPSAGERNGIKFGYTCVLLASEAIF
jgi:hypothetical protein